MEPETPDSNSPATPVTPAPPIMDVQAPANTPGSTSEHPSSSPSAESVATHVHDKPVPQLKTPSKKATNNGTTLAIVATVIIVLGIAVLAVVAYVKTRNS